MDSLSFLLKEETRVAQLCHPDLLSLHWRIGSLCQRSKRPWKQILNIPIFHHVKILSKDSSLISLHMPPPSIYERENSWMAMLHGLIFSDMEELYWACLWLNSCKIWRSRPHHIASETPPPRHLPLHHQPHAAPASFGHTLLLVS